MNIRKMLFPFFVFTTFHVYAQQHWFGVTGGVSFTNVSSNVFENTDLRNGFNLGFTYEYFLTKSFSLNADVLYAQRGFKDHYYLRDADNNYLGTRNIAYDYNYISIPIKVKISGKRKIYPFVSLGIVPALLVKAKVDWPEFSGVPSSDADLTDYATRFDIGGILEFGGAYRLSNKLQVTLAASGQLSFNTFTNESYFSNSYARHYGFCILTSLKYKLPE